MRIISGRFRGRDLGAISRGVRPTSDRVRESLFSVLGSVEGLRVLDLFAGTGALGLEAFSRGAEAVVFVDRSRRVLRDLQRRLSSFGLADSEAVEVISADAKKAIGRLEKEGRRPFDLVFLDPPYAGGDREATLTTLFASPLLSAGARVVVEGPKGHPLPSLPGVRVVDERRYGDTVLTWLEESGRSKGEDE